ncbi:site-specific DNA-methyltransferase [Verrucomicrobia bacterium S94]|nr:site-specific DNA-methyltransferase [Verrucomicrobia bacterium S94]
MATKLDQLKSKLRELFQLDRPDLDFGFYRVMHAKQAEIETFLDKDLLPQVKAGLAALKDNGSAELAEAIKQAEALGVDPDTVPKVQELKARLGEPVDLAKTEDAIYSHLIRFFSRYYDAGDFISMRRYKEGVYAIPYEGEEVVLHWANKDQYYIKSSENLRDYTVRLAEGDDAPRLHFKLVEADIEKDNRKAADDKKRLFIFNPEKTEILENEVVLGFEYRADPDNRKQEAFITACVDYVKEHAADFGAFAPKLLAPKPTEKRKDRTVLEKHLVDYTAKNSMDYFIHKDLGGFLRRELDFYIKNEVMHLDDIEHETAPRVESYLVQIRVLRGIAHKLIDFLAQLEEFQKKLWLKKKFVVESNWCITLDRVPENLYPEIAANKAQWAEWEKLGFLVGREKAQKDTKNGQDELGLGDNTVPDLGTVEYLKAFPYMVIDTAFYDAEFKQKLLAAIDNIDEQTDGLLIHSENFQALNLLQERYREQVKCVYFDPPYNTGDDGFAYKDNYQSSSWATMMNQAVGNLYWFLDAEGSLFANCDENEFLNFGHILQSVFGEENHVETITWNKRVPKNDKGIGNIHEYIYLFAKDQKLRRSKDRGFVMRKDALEDIYELIRKEKSAKRDLISAQKALKKFYKKQGFDRGITLYCELDPNYEIFGKINMSWPNAKTEGPRYEVISPATGKPVPIPDRGWRWKEDTFRKAEADGPTYKLPDGSVLKGRIWYSPKETIQPSSINYLKEVESFLLRSIISLKSDGSIQLENLGLGGMIDYPKPVKLAEWIFYSVEEKEGFVLDCFAGSGTAGHGLMSLNREYPGQRKFILIEMGDYFDTVLKPRIQKVVFSKDWKKGKPTDPKSGISHCFKYLRLESYEDCLNNLELKRTAEQDDLLKKNAALKEDYTLHYMLDVECKGSLLNVSAFADPFSYSLKVATGSVGETKPVNVDLIETFNYLIGLKVQTQDLIKGVTVLTGENLAGEKILVLWRRVAETDSEALNDWFVKQGYSTKDMEFDIIYVNGDNHLENLRKDEQTWKVRLIEEEFMLRMFPGEGSNEDGCLL